MSILDSALARSSGAADSVLGLAKEVKLDPALAEKAVIILAQSHIAPGDTMALATQKTGLDASVLTSVAAQAGGDAGLTAIAERLSNGLNTLGQGNFFKDLIPGMG
ncbi:MAG: hypothetical protein AAGH57_09175 [Pseudomonadota bacterium]